MEYKSIRQTLAMSSSTAKPKDAAEEEYQKRLNGYSTYRSGIEFEGHEMFAVAFQEVPFVVDTRMNTSESKPPPPRAMFSAQTT